MPMLVQTFRFRWNVKQSGPKQVDVEIPVGPDAPPILTPDFVEYHGLSQGEVHNAEATVVRSIALIDE